MLLKTNKEVLQRSVLPRNHLRREMKTLLGSEPNELIGIVMKMEDGTHI